MAPIEILEGVSPDDIVRRPRAPGRRVVERLAFGIADPVLVNDARAVRLLDGHGGLKKAFVGVNGSHDRE